MVGYTWPVEPREKIENGKNAIILNSKKLFVDADFQTLNEMMT